MMSADRHEVSLLLHSVNRAKHKDVKSYQHEVSQAQQKGAEKKAQRVRNDSVAGVTIQCGGRFSRLKYLPATIKRV